MSAPITSLERRTSLALIGGSIAVYVALLALTQPLFPSFDEAKYLGIGYRFLAGEGPRTLFGIAFTPHSPLWPMAIAAPDVYLGLDGLAVGRALNAVAGAGLLALVAAFAWPIRPGVAALAVSALAAFWYLHDLTRTARLDVPVAALCLLYVWVGTRAVRSGRIATAVAAGAIFAVAFLVKEIALPFAPVPFLVGILERRTWTQILRTFGIVVLVSAIGTSWWFIVVADLTDRVYRLGTPAWTLLPLVTLGLIVVIGCLSFGAIAQRVSAGGAAGRIRVNPTAVAWCGAIAWFVLLTVFFTMQGELKGNGLFQPRQYLLYVQTWLPAGATQAAVIGVGALLSLWVLVRGDPRTRAAVSIPAIALLCSAPLVLLVVAVGEPPRNYLAQIGLLAILAATGWWLAAVAVAGAIGRRVLERPGVDATGDVAERARRWEAVGLVGVLVGSFLLGTGALAFHASRVRASPSAAATTAAIETTTEWIRSNVPTGAHLGFGSFSSHHMALGLRDYALTQIHQILTVYDPAAPLALTKGDHEPIGGWIAIDRSRRALEFFAFHGQDFVDSLRRREIDYYVYATSGYTSVPALVEALTPEHGFETVAHWSWPVETNGVVNPLEVHIYRVDRDRLDFTGSPMYVPTTVLTRLVDLVEDDGREAATAAATLAERVVPVPSSAEGDALIERLRRVAGD